MSKSKGNYIGLTESPDNMYGKVMSIPDTLMANYYQLLTDLPNERITSLTDSKITHPREAKDVLGRVIVEEFHNAHAAEGASQRVPPRFSGEGAAHGHRDQGRQARCRWQRGDPRLAAAG